MSLEDGELVLLYLRGLTVDPQKNKIFIKVRPLFQILILHDVSLRVDLILSFKLFR